MAEKMYTLLKRQREREENSQIRLILLESRLPNILAMLLNQPQVKKKRRNKRTKEFSHQCFIKD